MTAHSNFWPLEGTLSRCRDLLVFCTQQEKHEVKLDTRDLANLLSLAETPAAIPMILTCPSCGERHIDEGEFAVKVHHTHACQGCGMVWRPAKVATVGVQFLPGYKS